MILLTMLVMIVLGWLLFIQCSFINFNEDYKSDYNQLKKKIRLLEEKLKKISSMQSSQNISSNDLPEKNAAVDGSKEQKEFVKEFQKPSVKEFSSTKAAALQNTKQSQTVNNNHCDKSKSGFEKVFFGNLFNKIGAFALIIAFVILFVSQLFTPAMRLGTGFIAGFALVCGAFKLHKDQMKAYSEVLFGTGLGILFISTYCACALFDMFMSVVASVLAIVLLIATYFIADKFKSYSSLCIGLFAGYINPFFITRDLAPAFLFWYFIFLNALSLIFVYKNLDKKWLNVVNLILTSIFLTVRGEAFFVSYYVICPVILWIMYLSFDLVAILNNKMKDEKAHYFSSYLNFGILTMLSLITFKGDLNLVGIILLLYAAVYGTLVCIFLSKGQRKILRPYLYSLFACIYMSTLFLSSGMIRVIILSFETLLLTSLRYRLDLKHFTNWILFFALTCSACLINVNLSLFPEKGDIPILNSRIILFLVPVLILFYCSRLLGKCSRNRDRRVSLFLKFLYSTYIYLYAVSEFNAWSVYYSAVDSVDSIFQTFKSMTNICIGFVYAMHLRFLFEINKSEIFKWLGYLMWGVSALFLILLGSHYSPVESFLPVLNLRFFAFAVAIASVLVFAKLDKKSLFSYLAVFLGFLLISYETCDYLIKFSFDENSGFVLTILWLLYLGILSLFGLAFEIKSLKVSAIWIAVFAIFKIIFYDISGLDAIYKVLVFIILGLVMMLISYLYNKFKA